MIWNRDSMLWNRDGTIWYSEDVVNKYFTTLQEIKAIAIHEIKELTDSAINGGRYLEILDLITKAESEK